MNVFVNPARILFTRNKMLYGHFLEHFHRQIYGGIYDPGSPFADEDGLRVDVLEALRRIQVPVIRWPGGCFVSDYHWEDGVGPNRVPRFNKAWRVEEPNTFGTDEFMKLCRKLGCEPYICTNAGTGTAEEMSNWVEYCNLPLQGRFAQMRIANGHREPYGVKYWSIGNENYGAWEIGAKRSEEWSLLVEETAKMMSRVDPAIQLSVASLPDVEWNLKLLQRAGERIAWISIHGYWDNIHQTNALASYDRCMAYTENLDASIQKIRGLLMAFSLDKKVRIAFDEWNLRGWYHPNIHTLKQVADPSLYLTPRDDNDINRSYTMADAVFSACFLNTLLRNGDIVGMANFAPAVNTRGAIFTYDGGIVLRTTYHVFDLYVNRMGDQVVDMHVEAPLCYNTHDGPNGPVAVDRVDVVATRHSTDGRIALAMVNKHESQSQEIVLSAPVCARVRMTSLAGQSPDDYNDIGRNSVRPFDNTAAVRQADCGLRVLLPPHSVNIVEYEPS